MTESGKPTDVPSEFEVRQLTPADRDRALEIVEAGLREQAGYAEDEGFFERSLRQHAASVEHDPQQWWVAVADDAVVGVMRLRPQEDQYGEYVTIRELDVAEDCRRRGVGTRLAQHAIDLVTLMDATRLFVNSFVSNPGLNLFRGMGFLDLRLEMRNDKNRNRTVLWRAVRNPRQPWVPGRPGTMAPPRLDERGRFVWDDP